METFWVPAALLVTLRSLHSPICSIWNGWNPTPFHGIHMECFLAGDPAIFSFHTHYGIHGISNEFISQIHVLFHMDSMEQWTSNSVEKLIKWAIKNTIIVRNRTLNFADMSCVQVGEHSSSWTMHLLKGYKLPSLNCALDWSCPKRTSAIADARFRCNQQSRQLILNHHHHPQSSPNDTYNMVSSDGDNVQCCHPLQ